MKKGLFYNPMIDTRMGGDPKYYLSPGNDFTMRVSDDVRECVTFVGLPQSKKKGLKYISYKGTAFLVGIPSDEHPDRKFIYLVTAKHVATKLTGKEFYVRINSKNGGAVEVNGEGSKWWYHPEDPSVDVAVILWAPDAELFQFKYIAEGTFLTDEIMGKDNIGTGDEVFITGLFTNLHGSRKNIPIIRMGNIAMMPDEKVSTKIGDIDAYLIEARSIGGLSGSPVFVRKTVAVGQGPFYLLGLMHGHWDLSRKQKKDMADVEEMGPVNMGIAIVIPAKKILEVLNQPDLVQMRKQAENKLKRKTLPVQD